MLTVERVTPTPPTTLLSEAEFYEEIGRRVREARRKAVPRLSQHKLASSCGLKRTYLTMLENGKFRCSTYVLVTIARALRVPLHEILPLTEDDLAGLGDPEDPGWTLIRTEELEDLMRRTAG